MADGKARSADRGAARTPAKKAPAVRRRAAREMASAPRLPLGKRNWQVIGAGLVVIVAGFVALARGSITLAPFLLVLGYCVLLPVGILLPQPSSGGGSDAARAGTGE